MYQTTISSWALLLAKAIEHQGMDKDAVFRQAGLDPIKLNDPNQRYSSVGMKKLWSMAVELTGDNCIGLRAARFWHPTTLHALGFAWMASSSLREALQRTIRYLDVVSTATSLRMNLSGDEVVLEFPFNPAYVPAVEAVDAALAVLVEMCRSSYGEGFTLNRVDLVRNKPACAQVFYDFFEAPVNFASAGNAMCFDVSLLEKTLTTANPELVRVHDQVIARQLAELKKDDLVGQVKSEIIQSLPTGAISERFIAQKLNMSLRSLQRRLVAERHRYKQLLDSTRKDLALSYLGEARYSINEVAYLLGFSEPANFSRAFKRWTGMSPSQFREQ